MLDETLCSPGYTEHATDIRHLEPTRSKNDASTLYQKLVGTLPFNDMAVKI